jgi:hypothetical protein
LSALTHEDRPEIGFVQEFLEVGTSAAMLLAELKAGLSFRALFYWREESAVALRGKAGSSFARNDN